MDDDDLTPEEIRINHAIINARIKAIEKKAIKRLTMTDEEKEAFKLFGRILKDPELKDQFITMLIMGANGGTKSKTEDND